jgi:TPR repeat protein
MNRVEVNDAASISMLAGCYNHGELGLQQDHARAIELYARAAELGNNTACLNLGKHHRHRLKKAKFHYEARLWLDT